MKGEHLFLHVTRCFDLIYMSTKYYKIDRRVFKLWSEQAFVYRRTDMLMKRLKDSCLRNVVNKAKSTQQVTFNFKGTFI